MEENVPLYYKNNTVHDKKQNCKLRKNITECFHNMEVLQKPDKNQNCALDK